MTISLDLVYTDLGLGMQAGASELDDDSSVSLIFLKSENVDLKNE